MEDWKAQVTVYEQQQIKEINEWSSDLKSKTRSELHEKYGSLYDIRECSDNKELSTAAFKTLKAINEELKTRTSGYVIVISAEDGRHYHGEYETMDEAYAGVEDWLGRPIDRSQKEWYSNFGSVIHIEASK